MFDARAIAIINNLSELIVCEATNVASEQRHPSSDVDKSDNAMKEGIDKINKLRKMREEFENILSGIIY